MIKDNCIEDRIQQAVMKRSGAADCHEAFKKAVKDAKDGKPGPDQCRYEAMKLAYVSKVAGTDSIVTVAELLADLENQDGIEGKLIKELKYLVANGHADLPVLEIRDSQWSDGSKEIIPKLNLSGYLPKK